MYPKLKPFYIETPLPPAIEPLPEPTYGWIPAEGDIVVFVAHDRVDQPYRSENAPSNKFYTNETRNKIYRCDQNTFEPFYNDFMTVRLTEKLDWQKDIELKNSYRVLDQFVDKGYGWCDGDAEETTPYVDSINYRVIDCGGNRRKGVAIARDDKGREYVIVEMVQVVGEPPAYNYEEHPQYIQKQSDVTNQITWRTPPQGDVTWLNMCDDKYAAYLIWNQADERSEVSFYPEVPFPAKIQGYDVVVEKYCFQGSKTLVLVSGQQLNGWYMAEESPPSELSKEPYASLSWRDYKKYIECEGWPGPTVQNCGYVKS